MHTAFNGTLQRKFLFSSSTKSSYAALAFFCIALVACGGGGGGGGDSGSGGTDTTGGTVTPSEINLSGSSPTPIITPTPLPNATLASCATGVQPATPLGTDPLAVAAWHLQNTGPTQLVSALRSANSSALAGVDANVTCVHDGGKGITGKGVTVAVVDSGIQVSHEDLKDNVIVANSYNFSGKTSDPTPAMDAVRLNHGTAVSGIIFAKGWNGLGSRGIAPNAKGVGYTKQVYESDYLLSFGAYGSLMVNTTNSPAFGTRADGVGVFNFSAGSDLASPLPDPASADVFTYAAKYGVVKLRGGKGAVYLQSAGNSAKTMSQALLGSSLVNINCASSSYVPSSLGTISGGRVTCGSPNQDPTMKPYYYQIAGMNNTGVAASYSSAGSSNWVAGFAGEYGSGTDGPAVVTTDTASCAYGSNSTANSSSTSSAYQKFLNWLGGSSAQLSQFVAESFGVATDLGNVDPNCNYTGQMNGTSASAPTVSGIVALMLEANPNLTWQDVGYILAKTARKVDSNQTGVTLTTTEGKAFYLTQPWLTNAAGFSFQDKYGFGMVDGAAATGLAKVFTTPAGRRSSLISLSNPTGGVVSSAISANSVDASSRAPGKVYQAKVSFNTASTDVTGPMQLDITIKNTGTTPVNIGTLHFELTSPNGNKITSVMMPAFSGWYIGGTASDAGNIAANGIQKFRFQSNAFLGEATRSGPWTISVTAIDSNSNTISIPSAILTSHSL